jgi:hypothetical protein
MNERTAVMTAVVTRSYVVDGRLYCDIEGPGIGPSGKTGVPVCQLGGGLGRFLAFPLANDQSGTLSGAEVVVAFRTNRKPIVIGVLGMIGTEISSSDATETTPELDTIDPSTFAIQFDGAAIRSRNGGLSLAPKAGQHVTAALSGDSALRVSVDGEADDAAALASRVAAEINALVAKINAQEAQIAALTLAVATLGAPRPPLAGVYTPTPLPDVMTEQIASRALAVSGRTKIG